MEYLEAIQAAVSTVGFPIVCVFLLWKQNQDMSAKHKEEIDKITEAVTNNTLAINKLTDYITLKGGTEK